MEMANTTDLQQETSPTTETTITYDGCSETVDCPQCGDVWDQAEILRDDRTVGPLGCCGWRGMWDYTTTYGHHPGDRDYGIEAHDCEHQCIHPCAVCPPGAHEGSGDGWPRPMRYTTVRDVQTYVDGCINRWMTDPDDYQGMVAAIADAIVAQARDAGLGWGEDWSSLPLLQGDEETHTTWQRIATHGGDA